MKLTPKARHIDTILFKVQSELGVATQVCTGETACYVEMENDKTTLYLSIDKNPDVSIIKLYHEVAHLYLLRFPFLRLFIFTIHYYAKKPKCSFFLKLASQFLVYLEELRAWESAKKNLSKTEFWNRRMQKCFSLIRKKCLATYLRHY